MVLLVYQTSRPCLSFWNEKCHLLIYIPHKNVFSPTEASVCMCYTITVKQKTQHLFDEFSFDNVCLTWLSIKRIRKFVKQTLYIYIYIYIYIYVYGIYLIYTIYIYRERERSQNPLYTATPILSLCSVFTDWAVLLT